jgi:hypothetical protein
VSVALHQTALWFREADGAYLFYPFGAESAGYRVAQWQRGRLLSWAFWRIQLHIMTWTLFFVALIAFWAPTLSASRKLEPWTLAVAVVSVTAATFVISYLGDRVIYACLLLGCPRFDRAPSRSERRASSGQFGLTRNNLRFAAFPTSPLCLAAGLVTALIGLIDRDTLMIASGGALSAVFVWPVVLDCKERVQNWR